MHLCFRQLVTFLYEALRNWTCQNNGDGDGDGDTVDWDEHMMPWWLWGCVMWILRDVAVSATWRHRVLGVIVFIAVCEQLISILKTKPHIIDSVHSWTPAHRHHHHSGRGVWSLDTVHHPALAGGRMRFHQDSIGASVWRIFTFTFNILYAKRWALTSTVTRSFIYAWQDTGGKFPEIMALSSLPLHLSTWTTSTKVTRPDTYTLEVRPQNYYSQLRGCEQ